MTLLLTVAGLVYLVCLIGMVAAWFRAPEGFEDEHGFHYGSEKDETATVRVRRQRSFQRSGIRIRPKLQQAGRLHHKVV